ncbi:MAG: molybdate ABC transporter substrate-binding protein [Planctomycetota bacterium]|nr:molybdate ABC transporter substrate-binding protein [Planctomycetota bacterium]
MRFITIGLVILGCIGCAESPQPQHITVAAAASLTPVVTEALATWPGASKRLVANFAASSNLARQIENGAPAALFLSANTAWMDHLAKRGLIISTSRTAVAGNRLALVRPQTQPLTQEQLPNTLTGRWTTGNPEHVPLGRYTKAALQDMHWWQPLAANLVAANNARAALRLVEHAEVDWGIVYASDAASSQGVRIVTLLPSTSHPPISYPAALVGTPQPEAEAFLAWLAGPEGQALFLRHGFTPPPEQP